MKKLFIIFSLAILPSVAFAQVKVIKAPASYEFRDMGYDSVTGQVGIVGYEVAGSTKTAKVFGINSTQNGFTATTLVGLGTGTQVFGISSNANRIAGISKSPTSTGAGEGTTWLRSAPSSPIGIGFISGLQMTSRAQAAWTDGVVGDCGGVDAACKWSTNLPLVALAGHESGLALAYDTNSNGSIQVGFSSHQVFDGVAYYWNSAGIHKLQDPFNIQSIAYAISPNGNYIGGYVAEDTAQNSYINAAVWDANRNLILLKDSVGNRFEGAVLDVSDLGYAVGTTASGKGFIWHPSFDGVQSPYKGAQIFDTWLATIPGSNNTVLSPASKGVEAIAQNKVNGKLLFALSDYEAPGTSYYIETAVTGIASLPEAEALNGLIPVPDNVGVVAFGSDIQPKTITVKNAGLATLSLNAATLAGSGFTIMSNLPSTLAAGASTNLVVKLDTSVPTAKSAIITFLNNDDNENPYNFTLTGSATIPEADVLNGTTAVLDGTGTVAFGNAAKGSTAISKTLTVKNTGLAPLTMSAATLTGTGFAITTNVPASLAANASANLVVRFDTAIAGAKSGTISFANNDSNENPYNFALTGTVTVPEADVLNGTVAVLDGTGTVAFGNAAKGSAAISKTLTVKNTGLAPLTMSAATLTGAGFTIVTNVPTTLAAGATANLVVRLDTAIAGAKSATISFANNDSNENPYNFTLTGTVTIPEADVLNGTVAVLDGTGTVAFGNAAKGSAAISKTLTVKNTGLAPLTMSAATLTGAGFTIVTNVPTTLAAGVTANLVVRLDTAIAGAKSATISFANNDSNENPYNFTLTGTVTLPEADVLNGTIAVLDGTGTVAFGSAAKGSAAISKTLTVKNTGLAPLTMSAATLTGAGFTIVTNVPATLAAGASANLVVRLDTAIAGAKSATISFANNDSNENPYNFTLTGTVTVPEADVLNGTTAVIDGTGTVAFGNAAKGSAAISKTLTVKNTGLAPLTMSAATLTGTGFTIVTNVPATLAAGATANLVVRLDTAIAGAKSATISFANNDSNENPYNFTLTGTIN